MSAELLAARFASGAATVATCWLLERRDGVTLGFTDHDDDLSFDGHVFAAESGLRPFVLERSTGANVDTGQVAGALNSDIITEADILAGRYRGALLSQWLVDWSDPKVRVLQSRVRLGEIRQGAGQFEAELLSLSEALNTPVGRSYIKTCDAVLGDQRCGIDLDDPAYRGSGVVDVVVDHRTFGWTETGGHASGWFTGGQVHFTFGANAGAAFRIEADLGSNTVRRLVLSFDPPRPPAVGDAFTVFAGCDKRAATCRDKFSNMLNFRGFPHLPGTDWVTVYPRNGSVPKQSGGAQNG